MASSEQLQLSSFIKNIHEHLRNESKKLGVDKAWNEHCAKEDTLKRYAVAMHQLANKHWEQNYEKHNSTDSSRIKWVYNYCNLYFYMEERVRQQIREQDIATKLGLDLKIGDTRNYDKIRLLDVGSCYNPFKLFECFDVTAIDIAPANADVLLCDFLNVDIVAGCDMENKNSVLCQLPQSSFDVVVFSLLLEYLPCPEQRILCCKKTYELLRFEGLLIIITPDSKHVGANAKFMKSWRYNLAKIGFSRIKYEKLSHIHCMAFRKSLDSSIASRWALLQNSEHFFDKIYIPQDFNVIDVEEMDKNSAK